MVDEKFIIVRVKEEDAPPRPRVALVCGVGPGGPNGVECASISMGLRDLHAHSGHHPVYFTR
eukprot:1083574-Heterocapsa_arctica.AAC.1